MTDLSNNVAPLNAVEQRGIEPVPRSEQHGYPLQLFWVWFAANISVIGLPLGISLIALDLSVWQAAIVAIVGAFGSFAVVGLTSIFHGAGERVCSASLPV
ncbi:MAG: cytosine permease, partial [Brachybacterium sp.]|uniref:cytosine permease n=1 Tax=Brachybacterium sp. TaxID=1891286 RepID=UPI002649E5BD